MKRRILILLLVLMTGSSFAFSQSDTILGVGYLSVRSTQYGIHVYDDTVWLGTTPLHDVSLKTGNHILRYVGGEKNVWPTQTVVETLQVASGERIEKHISLPVNFHITSEPYSAKVILNDSVVGTTPCFFSLQNLPQMVMLKKSGFSDEVVLLTETTNRINVVLSPSSGQAENISYIVQESTRNDLPIYFTAAATITSGVAAVYFKVKADNTYADYRQTGNGALIQQVKNYDTVSGISLAISEVGLGFLTYLLLSR
jgi:hypothetical protein